MKVIGVDNFGRDNVSDKLICGGLNKYYANLIATLLNENGKDPHTPYFYKAVEDDYELYKWKP
jgi:hypothetical protein